MTRSIHANLLISIAALALAGCAAKSAPPPAISFNPASFKQAVPEQEPAKPVQVVEVPTPLPLPGQLQPPPSTKADTRSPTVRVEQANKAALHEPTKDGYIDATNYPYTDGALYGLEAAPDEVTDVELQSGEALTAISAGDTVRWVVGNTTSGAGTAKQVHVLVKPMAAGLATNLVVTTDRRTHHLALQSTDHTSMAAISWNYPQDTLFALQHQSDAADTAAPIASGVVVENLRFRYAISGDSPPWKPVRAFDDTHKVYIEFPARLTRAKPRPCSLSASMAVASWSTTACVATTTLSIACSPPPSCAWARTRNRSCALAGPMRSQRVKRHERDASAA